MKIRNATIESLASKGITVKWYPDATYEDFRQRMWKEQYDYAYNYSKDNVADSQLVLEGRTNVLYNSVEELEESSRQFADMTLNRHCDPYEFTTLYVEHDDGQMLIRKENVKSKEITEEYILKLVEKDRKVYAGTYGRFAMAMQKLCKERGLSDQFFIYPTTYGIGVWIFYNWHADTHVERVRSIMDEKNIEYYNEFSEHGLVYRFKISKKSANIDRICA